MVTSARRIAALAAVVVGVMALGFGSQPLASAIPRPMVDPGPPPTGTVGPTEPTELKSLCGIDTGTLPQTDYSLPTGAEAMLDYRAAWTFARGAGQKVAVIDTGVNPHPRLPGLQGGGDYVSNTNGLVDCDAHGTLVAGIIAGTPSSEDGFAGVAPEAMILSIRQNSAAYGLAGAGGGNQSNDPNATTAEGYGNTRTLAYAISHAVSLGATIINLSEVACSPVGAGMDDKQLGLAVRDAFEHNVVVVAAAGNFSSQGLCSAQNAMPDPNLPLASGWDSVHTIASPAWYEQYVLTVGAVTPSGEPADFSLRGPWVGVAAPGERITSLNPKAPNLTNMVLTKQGWSQVNGTSFAAPFVSGLVALIRSRFPELNAGQVIELVKRTAHTPGVGPNEATGYGVIDPVAALSNQLVPPTDLPNPNASSRIAGRPHPSPASQRPRIIVFCVTAGAIALMAIAWAGARARRRHNSAPRLDDVDALR